MRWGWRGEELTWRQVILTSDWLTQVILVSDWLAKVILISDWLTGCEGGACQFSVVSLLLDKLHPHLCCVLLSTGEINVIDLNLGHSLFYR